MSKRLYRVVKTNGVASALRPLTGGADVPFAPSNTLTIPAPGTLQLVLDEQWTSIDPTRWAVYDNSNYGSPQRVQLYKKENAVAGTGASSGATGGTSLKLFAKRETVTLNGSQPQYPTGNPVSGTFNFTSGMLDSRSVGVTYARYGRYEWRSKMPHGQGLWTSIWLTCDLPHGGASMWELDVVEYFHGQLPGYNSTTLHGSAGTTATSGKYATNRYTNNGSQAQGNGWGRTYFEHPTYTPGWHTWTQDIVPVTDATGTTKGDVNSPSQYVKYTTYLDGKKVFEFVDTAAMYYTSNGGDADNFVQFFLQGTQIAGPNVGYVDDPLGYDAQTAKCMISGTPPNSCAITRNGTDYVQRAQFGDPSSVVEIDYIRVYKLTS